MSFNYKEVKLQWKKLESSALQLSRGVRTHEGTTGFYTRILEGLGFIFNMTDPPLAQTHVLKEMLCEVTFYPLNFKNNSSL